MTTPLQLDWGQAALQQRLAALLPGLQVQVLAECGSTNSLLLERARAGGTAAGAAPLVACLLVAEHQTQGRGRQGKVWASAAGASLTFSLALPLAPARWDGLSLAVGLALADALDPQSPGADPRSAWAAWQPSIGLKWPNDLLLLTLPAPPIDSAAPPGLKVGGILIETVQAGSQRWVVIGVGLNLAAQPPVTPPVTPTDAPPVTLSWGYGSLQTLNPALTAPKVLAQLAPGLLQAVLTFEQAGFAPSQAGFARRDVLAGRTVTTTLPDWPQGVADGVDETGALWLRHAGQRRALTSGELSLRWAAPQAEPPLGAAPAGWPC